MVPFLIACSCSCKPLCFSLVGDHVLEPVIFCVDLLQDPFISARIVRMIDFDQILITLLKCQRMCHAAEKQHVLFFCQFRKRFLFLLFLIKLPAVFKSALLCLKALAVCIQLGEPHFSILNFLSKKAFLLLQLFHRLVPFFFSKAERSSLQTMHFFQQQFFCNPYFIFIRFLHKIRHVFFPSGLIDLLPVSIHRKTDCIPITITVRSEQSLPVCFRSADRAVCQVLPQNSRCRVSFFMAANHRLLL